MKTFRFLSEGIFHGGSYTNADLEGLRFSANRKAGTERWVIDFSQVPRFQLRYVRPPKFILTLEKVETNFLERARLKTLVNKSRFIKDIVLYPPVEDGTIAMEFILKDAVLFEAHQPKENSGRLVIDLKNAPL